MQNEKTENPLDLRLFRNYVVVVATNQLVNPLGQGSGLLHIHDVISGKIYLCICAA
jgi:hypothetical protein